MLTGKQIESIKAAGFVVTHDDEIPGLTDAERQVVELRAAIALRVRELRAKSGLTQAELAERMGSSQSRVAKVEDGAEGSLDLAFRALFAVGGRFNLKAMRLRRAVRRATGQKLGPKAKPAARTPRPKKAAPSA